MVVSGAARRMTLKDQNAKGSGICYSRVAERKPQHTLLGLQEVMVTHG